jgi:hypothetical protein
MKAAQAVPAAQFAPLIEFGITIAGRVGAFAAFRITVLLHGGENHAHNNRIQ